MTPDRTEHLIRAALAEEARHRPDPALVLSTLDRRPRRNRTPVLVAAAALAAVVAVAAIVVPRMLQRGEPVVGAPPGAVDQNVLLAGIDDAGFADSVVLGHFGHDGTASLVSIPRDSWVDVPGFGMGKLNSAYAQGGANTLVRTVQELTGVHVDHYALVDMSAFGALSSAVGGVPVCLSAATHDSVTGASFPAGQQVLEGSSALAFLRQRHGLPNGDLDRVVRLQAFLRGLANQALSGNLLTDAQRLNALLNVVRTNVRTDPGWDLLAFAGQLRSVRPGEVRTGTVPTEGETRSTSGSSLGLDPAKVRTFVANPPAAGAPDCVN
ncbi:LCP family protein [Amycolatopsis sacchari]|uniref:Cell envelope-related function transcriptional attenuator common domain-containing protein n=1 Tax=Amycolatopsis sacchari TaxID=115433 RepID=A0A1I3MLH9_9PSEU|nr:LCP family protein [Amycolatopsis sacchari]SFI97536.1 cell envelope-related function transcriptional attenuator common domain-containing protein [Amycolatopsis sacchari]